MSPRSLQTRLLLTFVSLAVIGLGSVSALSGWRLTAEDFAHNERDLELHARLIADALREPLRQGDRGNVASGGRTLDALVTSYAQGIGGRVTLLDPQLNVTLSSDSTVPVQVQETHSEVTAARDGTLQSAIRWDEWSKQERMFIAAPVAERGQTLGFIQVSVPTAPIYAEMQQTWLTFLAIGSIVLLVTVAASTWVARQIAVPVQKLTTTSEQIAAGHLEKRVVPSGPNEIRRLGSAFNQMAERVQEMVAQQRVFVDNAAHELRSPLTGIRLRIEMLQTRGKNDAELTQHYLGQMEREVSYLQRLVDYLLALASVENRERVMPKTSLDLARILFEASDEMGAVVHQAGLTLETDMAEQLPSIEANADQMTILIRNLIDNAIKYTPRGGTITLTTSASSDEIEIRVTDTGIGIPPEQLPHIFDRFYRGDAARSRDPSLRSGGGAGLGLALVRAIAEAHGGRVQAESRVNAGSTFIVHLPLHK
jgi:two-component system, OmpR family, sensor histidine kinase BaeS